MSRRFSKNDFIEKSIRFHGDVYDYSSVKYINDLTDVEIICKIHGVFHQKPNVHYRSGCSKCGLLKRANSRKNSIDELLSKFEDNHGDKFDYSHMNYVKMRNKVEIKCNKHNIFFLQTPEKHLSSKTGGCPKCNSIGKGTMTTERFIEKSKEKHGCDKYIYDLVNYIKSNKKVKIVCKNHGEFEITPNHHIRGGGCSKCSCNHKYNINDLIKIFINLYGDKYEYDFSDYKNIRSKITVKCKNHSYFETTGVILLNGYGCSSCGKKSIGEERISNYLIKNNIVYQKQKSFNGCIYVNKMQFDFFLPHKNICIEYDGKQHFEPIEYFGGYDSFESQKKKDSIKNKFCMENNLKLIRIPYYQYKDIEKILQNEL
jgi:very-short-patch-repair endonuclease